MQKLLITAVKNGVKNVQDAAYNGACTVYTEGGKSTLPLTGKLISCVQQQ